MLFRADVRRRCPNFRCLLVEAQGTLSYEKSLKDLAAWLAAKRIYAELYLATMSDGVLPLGLLAELDRDGVGLLVVHDNLAVDVDRKPRNPALVVTPDPTLKSGTHDTRPEIGSGTGLAAPKNQISASHCFCFK